jgi:hypothetical protein
LRLYGSFGRKHAFLVAVRVGQKTFQAFDKLIAKGKVPPALRQKFMVGASRGIVRLLGALLCTGSALKAIRNVPTKLEEHSLFLPSP